MARKKTAKSRSKKTIVKRQQTPKTSVIQKMEKDFRQMPALLAAQCRTELQTLKQQDLRLKGVIKKAQLQLNVTKKKQATLAKAKTPAAKKQLQSVKKSNLLLTKTMKTMMQQLEQIKKATKNLVAKQNKFSGMSKQLIALDKQLEKKANSSKASPTRKRAQKKPVIRSKENMTQSTELPFVPFHKTETTEVE